MTIIKTICLDKEADELLMKIPYGKRSKFLSWAIKKTLKSEKKPDTEP